jgi:hypothetical protein
MQLDDSSFELIPGHPTTFTAIASGAILSIVTFGLKNIFASLLKPGSLVVVKVPLRRVLLPPHALQLARTAHALLALHSSKHNATLKKQVEASNSDRKSIVGTLLTPARIRALDDHTKSTAGSLQAHDPISPLDSLPMPRPLFVRQTTAWAAPSDSEPREDAILQYGTVPVDEKRVPREDSDVERDASPPDCGKAALCAVATRLLRECELLKRAMCDFPPSGSVGVAGSLAAQIRDARAAALEVVHEAIAVENLTHSSVDRAARSQCHVPSARPHEVRKEETLLPRFSAFLTKHRRLRRWLRALANLAWVSVGALDSRCISTRAPTYGWSF